ncbi:hypothetical protein SLA2020_313350 [Shorea laevis]
MKRKRSEMEKGSEIKSAIEEVSMFGKLQLGDDDPGSARVPTKSFLHLCKVILNVLDKIGPTMVVLRQDVHQNIERLEMLWESAPSKYSNLVEILKKEKTEGNAKKGTSCSRAFLWLTRSLDFSVALLQKLAKDPEQNMDKAVEESYETALKPCHGWISAAAFKIALKLVPDGKDFIALLKGKDESYDTLKGDMESLVTLLAPILEVIHSILRFYNLDKLKSI